jgi:hypothetical protein
MSATRISFDWAYRGFGTCILENEFLKVTIVPEVGAKVHEMIFKPSDRDLLFHHPRVEQLDPGQEFEASTRLIGFSTREHVKGFDDDGRPMS